MDVRPLFSFFLAHQLRCEFKIEWLSPSPVCILIKSTLIGAIVIGLLQPQFVYNSLGGAPKRMLYLPRFLANPAWGGLHSCDLSLIAVKLLLLGLSCTVTL